MRRLRLTFYAPDAEVHPVHTILTQREYVDAAEMIHWNAASETITHVFRVAGDREAFADELAETPEVLAYDIEPVAADRFHAAVRAETTPVQRELFAAADREGVVVASTLEHTDDGGVTFEVVGEARALQGAFDSAPDGIEVEVERVGGTTTDPDGVVGVLSNRQREAVEVAVEAGYYDVPRTATHEDVAAELECAPSTASEHLQKAESKLLRSLFA